MANKSASVRERFIEDWTREVGSPPQESWIDVVVNFDPSEHSDKQLNLQFEDTTTTLVLDHDWAFPALRTLFSSARDLHLNCPNFRIYENLMLKDKNGKTKWDFLEEERDRCEIMLIFGMYYWIWDKVEDKSIRKLTVEEVMNNDEMPEEIRALLFTTPELNLSEHLDKVDVYVNSRKNNHGKKDIVYELFKGEILGEPVTYVRTYDASTDRMFFLAVRNDIDKAIDAPASLFPVPEKLKPHVKAIYRQGEKFACSWKNIDPRSDEFKQKFDSPKSYFTGEEYFKLMEFES